MLRTMIVDNPVLVRHFAPGYDRRISFPWSPW